jgi:hypothetical protein
VSASRRAKQSVSKIAPENANRLRIVLVHSVQVLVKVAPGLIGVFVPGATFEQYTAFLQRLSTKTPLILFVDDLQWADNASLGLLFHLGRHVEPSRISILGCYRPKDVALGRGGERHPLELVVHELTRYKGSGARQQVALPV